MASVWAKSWEISLCLFSWTKYYISLRNNWNGMHHLYLYSTTKNSSLNLIMNWKSLCSCCLLWIFWVKLQVHNLPVQRGSGLTSLRLSHMILILVKNSKIESCLCLISSNCYSTEYICVIVAYPNISSKSFQISFDVGINNTLLAMFSSRLNNNQDWYELTITVEI